MTSELAKFLRNFEHPGSPCAIFTPKPDEAILIKLREYVSERLLKSVAGPTSTSGDNLWFECLILTDHDGRIAAGFEPVKTWTKPIDPQRSLF